MNCTERHFPQWLKKKIHSIPSTPPKNQQNIPKIPITEPQQACSWGLPATLDLHRLTRQLSDKRSPFKLLGRVHTQYIFSELRRLEYWHHQTNSGVISLILEYWHHQTNSGVISLILEYWHHQTNSGVTSLILEYWHHQTNSGVISLILEYWHHQTNSGVISSILEYRHHQTNSGVISLILEYWHHQTNSGVISLILEYWHHQRGPIAPPLN